MADYQLRARIPHELADQVKDLIEEVNEKFPAAEATFSTAAREALQELVRRSLFAKDKILPVELSIKELGKSELETVLQGLELIASVIPSVAASKKRVEDELEWIEFQEYKAGLKRGDV